MNDLDELTTEEIVEKLRERAKPKLVKLSEAEIKCGYQLTGEHYTEDPLSMAAAQRLETLQEVEDKLELLDYSEKLASENAMLASLVREWERWAEESHATITRAVTRGTVFNKGMPQEAAVITQTVQFPRFVLGTAYTRDFENIRAKHKIWISHYNKEVLK